MDLLERYLKQIERYLPFKERKDTIKELRSLILDQVDEYVTNGMNEEDAVFEVIKSMGEPRETASKYIDTKPMISKEMEPIFILIMKIVSVSLPAVILFANALDYVFTASTFNAMDFLLNLAYAIPSAIYSLFVGYGFIFLFFYMIEKYVNPKFRIEEREFNPNLLPKVPEKIFRVSLFESILTILLTVGALYIFNLNQGLISVYYDGNRIPLLNENFDRVLWFINLGWLSSIGLHTYFIFKRQKGILSKTIEFLLSIYGGVIVIVLAVSNIFNQVVIEGYDLTFIPTTFKVVMLLAGIGAIIGSIVEYVKMFVNLDELEELSEKK